MWGPSCTEGGSVPHSEYYILVKPKVFNHLWSPEYFPVEDTCPCVRRTAGRKQGPMPQTPKSRTGVRQELYSKD